VVGAEKDPGFFAALRMTKDAQLIVSYSIQRFCLLSLQGRG